MKNKFKKALKYTTKYTINFLWDNIENGLSVIVKAGGSFLPPAWTTKLHQWLNNIDAIVQKKIDKF